jgi:hypothetical protein
MANVRSGNTWWVDTVGSLTTTGRNLTVTHIILTTSAASTNTAISDGSDAKFNIRLPAGSMTQVYDFSDNPVVFTTSINVTNVNNARLTFLISES